MTYRIFTNLKQIFCLAFIVAFAITGAFADVDDCRQLNFGSPYVAGPNQIRDQMSTADLNHDGVPDIIVSNSSIDAVSVFLGNNDGTFQPTIDNAISGVPMGFAVSDINGDGEIDLAVTTPSDQKVKILAGDGTGHFTVVASYAVPANADRAAAADINKDGWMDLAIGSDDLYMLFGGPAGLIPGPHYTTPGKVFGIEYADVNEDGNLDLALVFSSDSFGTSGIRVYFGNGQGVLTEGPTIANGSRLRALQARDFTNDGHTDIVAVGWGPLSGAQIAERVTVLGDGAGGFTALPIVQPGDSDRLHTADFNNDGKLDIVNKFGGVSLGNGDGTFTFSDGIYSTQFSNDSVPADMDGDGNIDLVNAISGLFTFKGKGNGKFVTPRGFNAQNFRNYVFADFNNDNRLDYAAITGNSTVRVFLQDSAGFFIYTGSAVYSPGSSATSISLNIVAGDFNNDGKMDMAFPDVLFNSLLIAMGNGTGQFTVTQIPTQGTNRTPEVIRTGDFNNDDKIDLVTLNRDPSTYTIYIGDALGGLPRSQPSDLSLHFRSKIQ